ncbi:ORF53 [Ranid herpesvirus 1]|uniref:ORF53 n=1 Tax=Ranid herpesvirus 1 TaxID=85655 RepID=Q14VQ5_9VIRU|nr:ORF53 [Ranid herpesvirus 1]ABG25790.1 ORF53 [Ranid herpesvirus 1]
MGSVMGTATDIMTAALTARSPWLDVQGAVAVGRRLANEQAEIYRYAYVEPELALALSGARLEALRKAMNSKTVRSLTPYEERAKRLLSTELKSAELSHANLAGQFTHCTVTREQIKTCKATQATIDYAASLHRVSGIKSSTTIANTRKLAKLSRKSAKLQCAVENIVDGYQEYAASVFADLDERCDQKADQYGEEDDYDLALFPDGVVVRDLLESQDGGHFQPHDTLNS